tara:strand:- start:349 stop:1326 length:978 start_codon:yes stop_codon:yes gene_type:complete
MPEQNLKELIKESRPNIKDTSIKMYESNLNKLKKMFDADDWKFLDDVDEVVNKLGHLTSNTRRNYYNSVIILLMALNSKGEHDEVLKKYEELRDKGNQDYQDAQASGQISDKQKENFVDIEEVYKMIETMGKELKERKIKKKEDLSSKDKALLQVYVMYNILVRIPLRNDLSGMDAITKRAYNKLSKDEKEAQNFMVVEKDKLWFVLNKYKTSSKYEELRIDIEDNDLKKLLRMYIRINGMGELFKSSTGKALSRNAISQLLLKTSEKYMNKKISTTMLRKIYLSSKYSDLKNEMKKDAHMMGHSVDTQQKVYVKEGTEGSVDKS